MSSIVKSNGAVDISGLESVLLEGDLSRLSPEQRISYYKRVCESVGLNVLTSPMEYIKLNGKLVLYAKRAATDQLRKIHDVSITIVSREKMDGMYSVVARATTPDGRTDESMGVVPVEGLKGENLANAMLKAETKAKRRVTLAICGLSLLDETEVDSVRAVEASVKTRALPKARSLDDVAEVDGGRPFVEASNGQTSSASENATLSETTTDAVVEYDQDGVTDHNPPYTLEQHLAALPHCNQDALGPWFEELQTFQMDAPRKRKVWDAFVEKCAEFELDAKSFKKAGAK